LLLFSLLLITISLFLWRRFHHHDINFTPILILINRLSLNQYSNLIIQFSLNLHNLTIFMNNNPKKVPMFRNQHFQYLTKYLLLNIQTSI
jgi:hypothetical protein